MMRWVLVALGVIALIVAGRLVRNSVMFEETVSAPVVEESVAQAPVASNEPELPIEPPVVETEAEPVEEESGIRKIVVSNAGDFLSVMSSLGLPDLEQRYGDWAKSRGYPVSDHTGVYLLEQPYEQYDDETLAAFAENGDMWAQQFLADRIAKERPADALALYHEAAIGGSINAIDKMVALYAQVENARVDGGNSNEDYAKQVYAVRDSVESFEELSFAWTVAGSMAGADPTRGLLTRDLMSRGFDEAQMNRACSMASGLYEGMRTARNDRGMGDFDRTPPPIVIGSMADATRSPCPDVNMSQAIQLDGCEEVDVVVQGETNRMMVCGANGG